MPLSLEQLARTIGAKLVGDGSLQIAGCAGIEEAGPQDLTFVANSKYARFLATTRAAAVVVSGRTRCPNGMAHLVADDPYFAFRNAMIVLHGFRAHPEPMMGGKVSGVSGQVTGKKVSDLQTPDTCHLPPDTSSPRISALAVIHPTAQIAEGACIHPRAVIEAGAAIGRNTIIYPGAYVGKDARVGEECTLYPNVAIYDRCIVGNRVILHASTVIGSDGFGYATHKGEHHKIPQTGIAIIEDDVEMGGGCVIERAAMGETRIGKGTKFADLISIGHGTHVGQHCLFVSLVGVSGSVEIGNHVVLGGQVGVAGHIKIGDRVQAMARTAIAQDVPADTKIGGAPAVPYDQAKRNALAGMELYELFKRVKRLERELELRPQRRSQSSSADDPDGM